MTETSESSDFAGAQTLKSESSSSFYLAALAFLLGLIVLLGWIFKLEYLTRPLHNLTAMNPLTALSLTLMGLALMNIRHRRTEPFSEGRRLPPAALYIIVGIPMILAALKVAGFPSDNLIFLEEHQNDLRPFLIPPTTVFNILILSSAVALSIYGTKPAKRAANLLAAVGFGAALFSIIGYSYNVSEFVDFTLRPMAIHSAIGFMITIFSILLLNHDAGFMGIIMSPNTGGRVSRVIIPMAVLFATLIGYTRLFIEIGYEMSVELGISILLTVFVSVFVVTAVFVARRLNVQDVQRRNAEVKLEREVVEQKEAFDLSERRFHALIDQSVDGLSMSDLNGKLLYQSPAAERITGYTIEERNQMNSFDLIHPDHREKAAADIAEIRKNPGAALKYIWRIRHKDGHYYFMEGVTTNHLEDPNIRAVVNNYRDVTERILNEEKVLSSERRFRALIENSADAIVLTDENLKFLYQSPSVERMTGISLEHRAANPNARYTYHEDLALIQKLIQKSKETPGKPIPFQTRVSHAFGHYIWTEGVITNMLEDESVRAMVFNYRDISERRKMEEQQALFTSLVNSSGDAIISKDLNGTITTWNRGAQNLFGYKATEAIGESIMILVPPDLRKEEISILQKIRAGENVETFETRRVRKDGSTAHITITASPIRNADGIVIGASNISHDIGERLDAERKLKSERSMLRTLIDNIPDYIYVKDDNSKHIINNKAMVGLIGAESEEETLGKSSMDFFGEGFAVHYLEEDKEILKSGKAMINFEETTVTKNGEQKYLLTTKVPLTDEQNRVIGIVGISKDITQQKQTELDLRTSKYFLERAQQVANIGHWTMQAGASLAKLFLSVEACRIFGIEHSSFDGRLQTFLSFVHPRDLQKVNKVMSLALVNQEAYSMDHRIVLKDGTEKWVHVQTEVTFDNDRGLPLLLGIVQDITERKKAESEILSLNAGLEKKVSERTSQLEAVNKELEAFSYSISHDLRAPLRIIDGFATILAEDANGSDERIAKHARTISRNATRMGQLIDDLLNFSRLGRTQIKVTTVDMRELVDDVIDEFRAADSIKSATIEVKDLHAANGDGSLLKQVWVNLLSNAIKYSSKKSTPLVEVGMLHDTETPTWYVKDNGAGFSMDYASKLFGVFQRLHKQDEFDGTGVGLALVQRIIVRHGGKVWAESQVNEGATFFFTLGENHH